MTDDQEQMITAFDEGYADGLEDLANKVLHLIWDSDYEITLDELEDFLIAEIGANFDEDDNSAGYNNQS